MASVGGAVVEGVVTRPDGLKHLDREHAAAFIGLTRAGEELSSELDEELRRAHGISLRAFEVLLHLAVFAPTGALTISDLTQQAPLSQSRVSRLVTELSARGLVERGAVAGDARSVRVALTEQGLSTFKAAQETHLAGVQDRLFGVLSRTEIRQLAGITGKILTACEAPIPSGRKGRH